MASDGIALASLALKRDERDDQIRPPSHRHAAPSAPWPWVDIADGVDSGQLASKAPPIPPPCAHDDSCNNCWLGYPQSLFPNWTEGQVRKSGIYNAIHDYRKNERCRIHWVNVDGDGRFSEAGTHDADDAQDTWKFVSKTNVDSARVHALFIESISGPVLQMLGAKYNIEPFFWSSSLNWIPSRFQSNVKAGEGDHLTLTLVFLRSLPPIDALRLSSRSPYSFNTTDTLTNVNDAPVSNLAHQMIDTQAPLDLVSGSGSRQLALDLLSVHLVRKSSGSVIISYHPNLALPTTTAPFLHERIRFAGQSVYWQDIFQRSTDPTFVLLMYIWHAMYAWDQAMEHLYSHICFLETRVIKTSQMHLTEELHVIRAHHLHYSSLLEDFRKTIEFIRDTENPAVSSLNEEDRKWTTEIMSRETNNLLAEVERLEKGRRMQDRRLKNVMNLVFSSVNIMDSKRMHKMTEAAVRDSAAMKQIAYLTMVFLPASFIATVFGMNVVEINPESVGKLQNYVGVALSLTIATAWVIMAFQSEHFIGKRMPFWKRLGWPYYFVKWRLWGKKSGAEADDDVAPGIRVDEPQDMIDDEGDEKGPSIKGDEVSVTVATPR